MIETGAYTGDGWPAIYTFTEAPIHATLGFGRSLVADQGNPSPKRKVRLADNRAP
jgi:hypothetical protein